MPEYLLAVSARFIRIYGNGFVEFRLLTSNCINARDQAD